MSKSHAIAWPYPTLFAHRGGGVLAPENTLAAMRVGQAHGFGAVEFDVKLSADSVALLLHDDTLERTSNGHGAAALRSMDEMSALDAGSWHSPAFSGEPIPRFSAVAHFLHGAGLMANVEIKPASGFEALTGEVVTRRILELWQGAPLPLVSSFSALALETARRLAPRLPIGYLCVRVPADWPRRIDALAAYSLHCAASELDDSILAAANAKGIPVLCYTVNDRSLAATLIESGVTSVFSDRIDLLARM